jgi:carboxyl-terminal processing protease
VCKLTLAAVSLFLASGAFAASSQDPKLVKYVNDALDIMEKHSIYRNLIYWEEFREIVFENTNELTELSDAHAAVDDALVRLGDRQGQLYLPDEADAIENDGVSSNRLPAWTQVSQELIDEQIGLITVPAIEGINERRMSQYIDEMQAAIKSIDSDDVCAWIVDLRDNTGGNALPMLTGIAPILGSGVIGGGIRADRTTFTRRVENGRIGRAEPSGRPYKLKNPYPPVAVLIGSKTSGAGEATAIAFIGREVTRTFGEPTAGLTTGFRPFRMEDDSVLVLSGSLMTDRLNRPYFGRIQPQVAATSDEIIDIAVEWLGNTGHCQ